MATEITESETEFETMFVIMFGNYVVHCFENCCGVVFEKYVDKEFRT